jgi:Ca-activated chloride channel family protein
MSALNFRFDYPWAAAGALLLSALSVLTFWLWHKRRVARLSQLGGEAAIERLAPLGVRRAPVARAIRVSAAIGLAALAFAWPRWGSSVDVVRSEGIDVVLAMDASLSMLAQDERPSRLERMKQDVRRFRASSPGDRVALLAFAGRSYILSPLTSDDGAIDLFLDNLDPSIVGQAGTAMAPTITQGVDLLKAARGAAGRALVILSDGEAWDDRAETLAAARTARDAEIDVVTVGFGTEGGAVIPMRSSTGTITQKVDAQGQVVITKYDPTLLREVAAAAGGEFIAASETDKGARIHQALARLDAKQRDVAEGLSRPLRTTWFLLPAILLLLLDSWFADGGSFDGIRRRLRFAAPLILLAAFGHSANAQSAPDAMELFKSGQYARAAQRWKEQLAGGDKHPSTLYNLGTALLAADSLDVAAEVLERAATVPDATLRGRALYNLGLAQLKRGMRPEAPDPRAFSSAISAYRTLLRQEPNDADAKWNYEMALRLEKKQQGGGGSNDNNNSPPQQQQRNQNDEDKSMSRQQAEQLLAAASREEKETQSRKQRGTKQDHPPGGKDW